MFTTRILPVFTAVALLASSAAFAATPVSKGTSNEINVARNEQVVTKHRAELKSTCAKEFKGNQAKIDQCEHAKATTSKLSSDTKAPVTPKEAK